MERLRQTVVAVGLFAAFGGSESVALDLVMRFNSASSNNSTLDPTGSRLTAIMNYVETYYEGLIKNPHQLTIDFWWEDIGPLAGTTCTDSDEFDIVTEAYIRFDSFNQG